MRLLSFLYVLMHLLRFIMLNQAKSFKILSLNIQYFQDPGSKAPRRYIHRVLNCISLANATVDCHAQVMYIS
ncbi:MAG: hypothetical protein ACI965_000092 [Paraglaciecola sp.]|jgi:hypothetical protein